MICVGLKEYCQHVEIVQKNPANISHDVHFASAGGMPASASPRDHPNQHR
jgi:hypothetical protein